MKKIYLDVEKKTGCFGVITDGAEVIRAGSTISHLCANEKNSLTQSYADEYDIHFIFSDTIPNINFYTIPQVDIFAVDSNGGLIGTIGQPTDFDSNAPICYIDKKRVCYLIAPNGATFLRNVANWKTDLHPCHDVVFYSSKSVAESELEFFDINKIDISLDK